LPDSRRSIAHAAETNTRYFESACTKIDVVHCFPCGARV
jgi:hypothetical protein